MKIIDHTLTDEVITIIKTRSNLTEKEWYVIASSEKFSDPGVRKQMKYLRDQWKRPKSKVALAYHLNSLGFRFQQKEYDANKEKGMFYEAYGKKVMAYVRFDSNNARNQAESFLEKLGWLVKRDYHPGSNVAEIHVSYFKAWHHDI